MTARAIAQRSSILEPHAHYPLVTTNAATSARGSPLTAFTGVMTSIKVDSWISRVSIFRACDPLLHDVLCKKSFKGSTLDVALAANSELFC